MSGPKPDWPGALPLDPTGEHSPQTPIIGERGALALNSPPSPTVLIRYCTCILYRLKKQKNKRTVQCTSCNLVLKFDDKFTRSRQLLGSPQNPFQNFVLDPSVGKLRSHNPLTLFPITKSCSCILPRLGLIYIKWDQRRGRR